MDECEKFTLAIVLKNTCKLIGWCGFGPLEFNADEIEIYFVVSYHYWGKGIATEAGGALLKYGFDKLELQRIVAVVNPENVASVRVIEKLNMQKTGIVTGLDEASHDYAGYTYYTLERTMDYITPGDQVSL